MVGEVTGDDRSAPRHRSSDWVEVSCNFLLEFELVFICWLCDDFRLPRIFVDVIKDLDKLSKVGRLESAPGIDMSIEPWRDSQAEGYREVKKEELVVISFQPCQRTILAGIFSLPGYSFIRFLVWSMVNGPDFVVFSVMVLDLTERGWDGIALEGCSLTFGLAPKCS